MKTVLVTALLTGLALAAPAQSASGGGADSAAIRATALDYGEGFYSGDASRMARAISEDLHKVVAMKFSENGKTVLQYSTFSGLVEMSRAKLGLLEPEKRKITVTILDVRGDLASAKLESARYNDYLQMVFIGGKWKIVNVLWTFGPDDPNRRAIAGFDPGKEKAAVSAAVQSYYEGVLSGNADLIERVVHPEISAAVVIKIPQSKNPMISRTGAGSIIEAARAKLRTVPEGERHVDVSVLDVMDGMAFARAVTARSLSYFQIQQMDGKWLIINILNEPVAGPQQPPKGK